MLFGARARGPAPDDADFDLLVVKDTNRRPLDRRIDVERILAAPPLCRGQPFHRGCVRNRKGAVHAKRDRCLHAQQAVEKGLKALLGWSVPLDTDDTVDQDFVHTMAILRDPL
jgi:hypothetical protein